MSKSINSVLSMLLFAVFALCTVAVLLVGARLYGSMADRDGPEQGLTLACSYISTKLNQADAEDGISIENFAGLPCLSLREMYGGKLYSTRIYCYDGWLCELFSAASGAFSPEDGEKIMPLDSMAAKQDGGLISIDLSLSAAHQNLIHKLRCCVQEAS